MYFLCQPEKNRQPCHFSSLIFANKLLLVKLDTVLALSINDCLLNFVNKKN